MKINTVSSALVGLLFLSVFLLAEVLLAEPKDTTVRVALNGDIATVNILEIKTDWAVPAIMPMHQTLWGTDPVTGNESLAYANVLSESMVLMKNGKDVKIKLKKGFRFHNGDPVTAEDVSFTYEQCVDPQNANVMASLFDEIEEIEVLDDHNLIMRFYEPLAAWKSLFLMGIASQKYYEKAGRKRFRTHPVGSGAFRFVKRKTGEYILLEADVNNPVFEPDFKRLKFLIVPDEITRFAMLETGELDLVSGILPHHIKRLQARKHIKIKKESRVPSMYAMGGKANNYAILKDRNFTRAVNMAINRQYIVDKIFMGEGYPLYMFANRSELGYDPTYRIEYNPQKARELLKQSSYKPGTTILMTYSSDVPMADMISSVIQRYLKKIGITLHMVRLEYGVRATYSRTRDPREGHYSLFSWPGSIDPSGRLLLTMLADSDYCSYPDRPKQEEIEELVRGQARETNPKKRLVLLNRLHKILQEDENSVILFGLNMIYAMNKRIEYTWLPNTASMVNLHRIKIIR